ncbi:MAG: hypothetical protein NC048_09645 [Bacteroides sp.]|nr:hypothetical protein [Ruminococcus flavefaciens]MCM1555737.1 hypothetical protein [Bacteroides sp.]
MKAGEPSTPRGARRTKRKPLKNRRPHTKPKLSPAQKEAIYALPLSKQFRIVHIDAGSGFAVYRHVLVDTEANDYRQVLEVAKAYAKETLCAINPIVNKGAPAGRRRIYPGIENSNANPDLTTEKYGYVDVKSPFSKSKIVKNANAASNQHAIAAITDLAMDEPMKHKLILQITAKIFSSRNTNGQGMSNYTQDQVHWFVNGKLLKYNRSEMN